MKQIDVDRGRPHRPRRRRLHVGRGRPRDARVRHGHTLRHHRAPPASAASRSAAASATSHASYGLSDRQPAGGRRWCWPTARWSRPARTRTRTCSGRSAAAAATSASSRRSCSGCTRSTSSRPARRSGRWSRRPRCCARTASSSPRRREELNGFFAFLTVPPVPAFPEELHGTKVCGVVWCYTGTAEQATADMAPMLAVGKPLLHGVGRCPTRRCRASSTRCTRQGDQWYWRADFVNELSDEAIERHVEFGEKMPTGQSTMHLYPIDGAVARRRLDRHRVQLPRRELGRGDRRRRPRPGQRRRDHAMDGGLLGRDCIPTRPAAPTSTS